MAEVQVKEQSGKSGKVRAKKQNVRVDMTPMVDLGFLCITFFIFTTTFSKPNVMDLGLPSKAHDPTKTVEKVTIDLSNSITFILGKDDRIFWHQLPKNELTPQTLNETNFDEKDPDGITNVILNAAKKAQDTTKWTVIIKPTDEANYKNFVDVLDEMEVTNSKHYGVTDISPEEVKVYKAKTAEAAPAN